MSQDDQEKHRKDRLSFRRRKADPSAPTDGASLPRAAKYAWGAAISALLALSLVLDQGSPLMPVINRMIDALQMQTSPSESR